MQPRIKIVNNDREQRFELWDGKILMTSLTPGQFADLMLGIKRFLEERNPKRTAIIQKRRERKIRRAIFWITLREKIREFFKKLYILK